jgi:hypothetical protein
MTVCASSTESNASTESTSSRTREPNDSTNGFCQGEQGSMKLRPQPTSRHQSPTALAAISGRVVHPYELRRGAALADDLVEHPHGVIGVDRAGDADRERLAGVLVDDVEQLQRPAVGRSVDVSRARRRSSSSIRAAIRRSAPSSKASRAPGRSS